MMTNDTTPASGDIDGFKAFMLGAALLVVAAVFLPFGLDRQADRDAEGARISAETLTVTGRITSSSLKYRCPLSEYSECYWRVNADFAYEVNGSRYSSNQKWRFYDRLISDHGAERDGGKAGAKGRVAQYAKDRTIPVYYHPSDPSGAWLNPKPSVGFTLLLLPVFFCGIWGVIIIAFGIYIMVSDAKT